MFDSLIALATRSFGTRLVFGVLLCAALMGLDVGRRTHEMPLAVGVWPAAGKKVASQVLVLQGRGNIPMPDNTPAAHASSLLALQIGRAHV